jgi:hypothetical protein
MGANTLRPDEAGGDTSGGTNSAATSTKVEGEQVTIHKARVVNVNIRDYTVDVRTMSNFVAQFDVPFMCDYCHPAMGEGVNFMPEVGSICWLCKPSDAPKTAHGSDYLVLGWSMPAEGGSVRTGRELLNPGDLHFSTRDGNFIFVRRGGIVQIGATPIAQTIYLPIRNIIQQFCENYELHTPGGDLTWTVERQEADMGGHKMTTFLLAAHEFADDPAKDPIVALKVGSHGQGVDTILSLQVLNAGGGTSTAELKITKQGQIDLTAQMKVKFDLKNDFEIEVANLLKAKATTVEVEGTATTTVKGGTSVNVDGGGTTMALSAGGAKVDGPAVDLGDAQDPAAKANLALMQWIAQVTGLLGGASAGVPVVTVGGALAVPVFASTKVKV